MQSLFDWIPPYQKNEPTSKAGSDAARGKQSGQCERIMQALRECGPSTASQLKTDTGIVESSTMAARLNSLMKNGLIVKTGATRLSDQGVQTIIWALK